MIDYLTSAENVLAVRIRNALSREGHAGSRALACKPGNVHQCQAPKATKSAGQPRASMKADYSAYTSRHGVPICCTCCASAKDTCARLRHHIVELCADARAIGALWT